MKKLSTKEWVAVSIAIVFIGYTLFGSEIVSLFNKSNMNEDNNKNQVAAVTNSVNMNDVIISDSVVGTGATASNGKVVSVNYVLALSDGTVLQNSKDFGRPFSFVLGAGQVIQGWERGFDGMKVGGVRTIVVPPNLGYGSEQVGPIPPNSTLIFTVELLDVADLPLR